MILTDNETRVDLLNNEAIATTIVKLLRDRPDRPVTIGVHGDWGAGKSSVLEMIDAALDGQDGVLCLKFNGWRFQGFEDAKIALIEGIVTGLVEKRPVLKKAADKVKNLFRCIDWLKVARKGGGLALAVHTGIPTPDLIDTAWSVVRNTFADPEKLLTRENLDAAIEAGKAVLKADRETTNVPTEIRAFREAFDELLDAADVKQLVVLIDDLDRCLPDTAIETLEAVRLFVFTPRTAFVVAADEAMIEYAVRRHFPELPDTTGPRDYARNYLEKLIQVPLRIPALGESETRIFVTLLLVGAALGDDDSGFAKLIDAARDRLKRPWEASTLDSATIAACLGANASKASSALSLSDQIGPQLARGTQGNPRQIKRFLNALLLRVSMAEARGFGDLVNLPTLAKLMLAERFLSHLFDQIAASAAADPNGHCKDLAVLEAADESGGKEEAAPRVASPRAGTGTAPPRSGTNAPKVAVAKPADTGALTEWLMSPGIVAWARIPPALSGVDLRPYIFVAKDRKDYFGPASALGHLALVVEKLLGPKLQVQGFESEIKTLAALEAAKVFEGVCARIMSAGVFDREPVGAAGLSVLVKAHPGLETNLIAFLDRLPRDHLGTWVVSGWSTAIKSTDGVAQLKRLLDAWSKHETNTMLAAAAASTLKMPKGPT